MENKILVETSARHIHLTEEHIAALFGEGHKLTVKRSSASPVSSPVRKRSPSKVKRASLKCPSSVPQEAPHRSRFP